VQPLQGSQEDTSKGQNKNPDLKKGASENSPPVKEGEHAEDKAKSNFPQLCK
jgi:hypothetical protein